MRDFGFVVVCTLVAVFSVTDAFFARPELTTAISLEQQEREAARITRDLATGDQIYTHDAAAVLVLARVSNANEFFFFQRFMGDYLDMVEPGGFDRWFERLKGERPKVVVLGERRIARADAFNAWLQQDYVPRESQLFKYYIRRDAA